MTRLAAARAVLIGFVAVPVWAAAETPRPPDKPSVKVAKAPSSRCVIAPIDLAITPRVSLNGLRRPCARNYFGLALGASRAGELAGLQIGLVANRVDRSAAGVQLALGVNATGGDEDQAAFGGGAPATEPSRSSMIARSRVIA